jgi:hypothetical protein
LRAAKLSATSEIFIAPQLPVTKSQGTLPIDLAQSQAEAMSNEEGGRFGGDIIKNSIVRKPHESAQCSSTNGSQACGG